MSTATKIEWTRGDDGSAGATWNPVPTDPGYSANARGEIRGPSGRILRPMRMPSGHLYVLAARPLRPRKLFVHRAVLLAFVGPPPIPSDEGRHLDGNPAHNRLANLAWGSRRQNMADKQQHGTQPKGERAVTAKLTEAQVREIRSIYGSVPLRQLAARYGVSHTAIRRAALGIKWRSVA